MNGNNLEIINQWFETTINALKNGSKWESNHITEILGEEPKEKWIDLSVLCMTSLTNKLRERRLERDYKILLAIPLVCDEFAASMKVPKSLVEMAEQLDIEPPGIYLSQATVVHSYKPVEEYACPVRFPLIPDAHFYTYYREHRYIESMVNEWEFSRAIYVSYYPEGGLAHDYFDKWLLGPYAG